MIFWVVLSVLVPPVVVLLAAASIDRVDRQLRALRTKRWPGWRE